MVTNSDEEIVAIIDADHREVIQQAITSFIKSQRENALDHYRALFSGNAYYAQLLEADVARNFPLTKKPFELLIAMGGFIVCSFTMLCFLLAMRKANHLSMTLPNNTYNQNLPKPRYGTF